MDLMKEVKFNDPKEVQDFVAAAGQCVFDIDIGYNRIIIDAKSLLGILSMDLSRTLTVSCKGYDPQFEKTLTKYSAA